MSEIESASEIEGRQSPKSGLARVGKFFSIIEDMSAVVLLLGIVFLICLSIFMRTLFNYESSSWEELARFLSLWMYLIAVAVASKENSHLKMGFFDDKIKSKRLKKGMEVFFNLISLACLVVFAKWSLEYVQWSMMAKQKSLVMMIGMWTVHLSFFIGSTLAAMHMLFHLVKSVMVFIGRKEKIQ